METRSKDVADFWLDVIELAYQAFLAYVGTDICYWHGICGMVTVLKF